MGRNRLEAFSDGVIAIIITIMALELKVPHGNDLMALSGQASVFLSYAMSFIYVAIYWNNHHHMLHTVTSVNGLILWANAHLLFWLSLVPFATAWMGENHFSSIPTAVYGFCLLMAAGAYFLLEVAIIHTHGKSSKLWQAVGKDIKVQLSLLLYATGILVALALPWVSNVIYAIVALMWLVPDKRIERVL